MTPLPRKTITMPSIRSVVFDLGNVLIDVHFQRCLSFWSSFSGISETEIVGRFSIDEAYERHERGEIDASTYFQHLRRCLQVDLTDAQFTDGWTAIIGEEKPKIRDAIKAASRLGPLFILTNTNALHESVWAAKHSELLRHFNAVFVSSRIGYRKPEPAIYSAVIDQIGISPNSILFLDDSEENIEGALKAGICARKVHSTHDVMDAVKKSIPDR